MKTKSRSLVKLRRGVERALAGGDGRVVAAILSSLFVLGVVMSNACGTLCFRCFLPFVLAAGIVSLLTYSRGMTDSDPPR